MVQRFGWDGTDLQISSCVVLVYILVTEVTKHTLIEHFKSTASIELLLEYKEFHIVGIICIL